VGLLQALSSQWCLQVLRLAGPGSVLAFRGASSVLSALALWRLGLWGGGGGRGGGSGAAREQRWGLGLQAGGLLLMQFTAHLRSAGDGAVGAAASSARSGGVVAGLYLSAALSAAAAVGAEVSLRSLPAVPFHTQCFFTAYASAVWNTLGCSWVQLWDPTQGRRGFFDGFAPGMAVALMLAAVGVASSSALRATDSVAEGTAQALAASLLLVFGKLFYGAGAGAGPVVGGLAVAAAAAHSALRRRRSKR
jgi:hypothetical protein